MNSIAVKPSWPALPLSDWRPTCDTLHLWTQVVGKVRLELSPHLNHWWEVPFYVSARGLSTSPIPYRDGVFEVEFDFVDRVVAVRPSWARARRFPLSPMTVAEFYQEFFRVLDAIGVSVRIWPMAVEIPHPVRLDMDRRHRSYEPEHAQAFWRILVTVDTILKEFRARFIGKDSPVHFFWGSFDLAVTRFSGRRAPPRQDADRVTREAYSHEVISAGWWPGDDNVPQPAFYCYATPEPQGFSQAVVRPKTAFYNDRMREYLLMYEDVRRTDDPRATLLDFLQATYEAGATLGHWDRAALEKSQKKYGALRPI